MSSLQKSIEYGDKLRKQLCDLNKRKNEIHSQLLQLRDIQRRIVEQATKLTEIDSQIEKQIRNVENDINSNENNIYISSDSD